MRPPTDQTVWQWSADNRVLPSESSTEPGRYDIHRFPFLIEIMERLSPRDPAQEIFVMKGSQLGFSEIIINWALYTADTNPSPMMLVQPTQGMAKAFSRERIAPSAELVVSVSKKLGSPKSRDAENTIMYKKFPGGYLVMVGTQSAAELRSRPIKNLACDEVDAFEQDVDGEGDPYELAKARTRNFPSKKVFAISSPGSAETSRIKPLYKSGSQAKYYIPCPHCGAFQTIKWTNIKYQKLENGSLDETSVHLLCEDCGALIDESFKQDMLINGEWREEYPEQTIKSYFINALYSPVWSWTDAVRNWINANKPGNEFLLRVFVNTVLGEPWETTGRSVQDKIVSERVEEYSTDVPANVLILTTGVDVQEDRLEVEIVGWAANRESWSIDYAVFKGDTEHAEVWNQLDEYLLKPWQHENGQHVRPAWTFIDSGYNSETVYKFCKAREFRNIYPSKGKGGPGQGWIKAPKYGKRNQAGVYPFILFVDEFKQLLYSNLNIEQPGQGYCHFPEKDVYDPHFFEMLTAEIQRTVKRGNKKIIEWYLPSGRRNEALDCRVLAMAGFEQAVAWGRLDLAAIKKAGKIISGNAGKRPIQKKRKRARVISKGVSA